MKFTASKIFYNDEKNWDELISITFLNEKDEYISVNALTYEDEIHIEYNEQINFLKVLKENCKTTFNNFEVQIDIRKIISNKNLSFSNLHIELSKRENTNKLSKALNVLTVYIDEG